MLTEPDREKKTFLLWMTDYFRSQLERTLDVLGIEVPEYMVAEVNREGPRHPERRWPQDEKIYTEAGRPDMSKYPILIAPTRTGFSAHVTDLPGCIATGRTLEEIKRRMAKAIEMHLTAMREDGDEIPKPHRLRWSRSPEGQWRREWANPDHATAASDAFAYARAKFPCMREHAGWT